MRQRFRFIQGWPASARSVSPFTTATLALLLASGGAAHAQQPAPPPGMMRIATPAEPDAIALYPESSLPAARVQESWNRRMTPQGPSTGRYIRNVTWPTITPVLPDPSRATGAAVIVAPGGAFQNLAIDKEGWDVARQLADRGIAAFILKYRLNETPESDEAFMAQVAKIFEDAARGVTTARVSEPRATLDALQALRVVRAGAKRWKIDPKRVGMIGFSAGAMTALDAVQTAKPDEQPDFLGYIYGPMTAVTVRPDAPPMFAALALDDGLFGRQGFGIVESWHKANRPVELHAYERGNHGFALGVPGTTTTLMLDEFVFWLKSRGLLARAVQP